MHELTYAIVADKDVTVYIDLTGRFPYRSSRGNEYVLVGYHYDANCILAEPLKNREARTVTNAWEKMNARFAAAGSKPKNYIMDNECSNELIEPSQEIILPGNLYHLKRTGGMQPKGLLEHSRVTSSPACRFLIRTIL